MTLGASEGLELSVGTRRGSLLGTVLVDGEFPVGPSETDGDVEGRKLPDGPTDVEGDADEVAEGGGVGVPGGEVGTPGGVVGVPGGEVGAPGGGVGVPGGSVGVPGEVVVIDGIDDTLGTLDTDGTSEG